MFGDVDWPLNASCGFVSISRAFCYSCCLYDAQRFGVNVKVRVRESDASRPLNSKLFTEKTALRQPVVTFHVLRCLLCTSVWFTSSDDYRRSMLYKCTFNELWTTFIHRKQTTEHNTNQVKIIRVILLLSQNQNFRLLFITFCVVMFCSEHLHLHVRRLMVVSEILF